MKHFTLEEKYNLIKQACTEHLSNGQIIIWDVWIGNLDIIHKIAEALDMKNNSGTYLHSLTARINKIMRDLIAANYPIKEYRIKSYSWSERETWHPIFTWEEKT